MELSIDLPEGLRKKPLLPAAILSRPVAEKGEEKKLCPSVYDLIPNLYFTNSVFI
jgi:hypothetical protein